MNSALKEKAIQHFNNLIEHGNKMLDILKQETKLIKSRDIEAIEAIAAEKQLVAAAMEKLGIEHQRRVSTDIDNHKLTRTTDYPSQSQSDAYSDPAIAEQQSQTNKLFTQCQQLNEANGASIELLRRHCQRSLEILFPQNSETRTYGPDGTTEKSLLSSAMILA